MDPLRRGEGRVQAMPSFYPKDYSRALRLLLLTVSLVGTLVLAHSLIYALTRQGWLWMWFLVANFVGMYFGVRTRVTWADSKANADDAPHSIIFGVGDIFNIGAMLLCSPEASAVVASVGPMLSSLTQMSKFIPYRWWFNAAQSSLMFFLGGKVFYWLLDQPPPLSQNPMGGAAHLLGTLDLALVLMLVFHVGVLGTAIKGAARQSQSEVFAPVLTGSLATFVGGNLALASAMVFGDRLAFWLIPGVLAALISRFQLKPTAALNRSRLLLLQSLDALSSALAVLDVDGRILATSEAWMLGEAPGLFGPRVTTGVDYLRFCREASPDSVATGREIADGIRDVMAGRRAEFFFEYCCVPHSPETFYALRVTRFESPAGPRFVVSHQDVSERKRSEELLRSSERRYRRFFEEDLTGDFVADGEGLFSECNPALARMLDLSGPNEAVGRSLFSFFSEPSRAEIGSMIRRRQKLEYAEIELNTAGGRTLNAVANLTARRDAEGGLVEIRGYLFDDTRRKKLESALLQAQKMEAVGRLAGGIAHRFNNILTIITGYGELLRDKLADHRQLAREVSLVLKAAAQGARLSERFLIFGGRGGLRSASAALDESLERSLPVLSGLLGPAVRLKTKLDAPIGIPAHAGQIEQVALNLVVNARDAMPEGGDLFVETSIRSSARGPEACLEVRDTGIGMDERIKSRLFEPFFTTKNPGRGTGLGLATVGEVLRQSGGRVEVESVPGTGSTFRVLWPVGGGNSQPAAVSPTAVRRGGVEIVLLVEDERELRRLLARILTEAGYRVLEAADGNQAIALASQTPGIDLLLTDVVMPGVGGLELVDRMRRTRSPEPRVLLMSGHLDAGPRDSKPETWFFLAKPFGPGELLTMVREVLDA